MATKGVRVDTLIRIIEPPLKWALKVYKHFGKPHPLVKASMQYYSTRRKS